MQPWLLLPLFLFPARRYVNYADPSGADRARQVLNGMRAGDRVLQVTVQPAPAPAGARGSLQDMLSVSAAAVAPTLAFNEMGPTPVSSSPLTLSFGNGGGGLESLQSLVG